MNLDKTKRDPFLLVRLAKRGDEKAYEELYNQYYTPIYRYIFISVKSREEAEDLAQTVLIKIYHNLDKIKPVSDSPASYFFKIAKNQIIDYFKKKKDLNPDDPEYFFGNKSANLENADNEVERNEEIGQLIELLDCLTGNQRQIIELKFIKDLNNKEISKITGKREATIRKIQSRAIYKLKNKFKSYDKIR